MGYTSSSLVDYVKISPNKTVNRPHEIDTITIHCVVGQVTVESLGSVFANPERKASSNYGVGYDGRIGLYVEEKDRSWCSSSSSNDSRAITIEVASDTTHPYAVKDAAYKSLIRLLVDICQRNGIKELKWKADKSLIGQVDKQNMTVHRWFANKSCPGDYLYERHGQVASEVNKILKEQGEVENMTKAELKQFIEETVRNMGKDAPASSWAVDSVEKAKVMGISDGSSPTSYATREQTMSMIIRAVETMGKNDQK